MWNAKRLRDSGAIEYIDLEWQCKYGVRGSPEEDDPRDVLRSEMAGYLVLDDAE